MLHVALHEHAPVLRWLVEVVKDGRVDAKSSPWVEVSARIIAFYAVNCIRMKSLVDRATPHWSML
jgi:hypothetical protein